MKHGLYSASRPLATATLPPAELPSWLGDILMNSKIRVAIFGQKQPYFRVWTYDVAQHGCRKHEKKIK